MKRSDNVRLKAASEAATRLADERAARVLPVIHALKAQGILALNDIAKALRERGVPKARGGSSWTATDVRRLLARSIAMNSKAHRPLATSDASDGNVASRPINTDSANKI